MGKRMIRAVRIGDAPIIHPGLCSSLGRNINGPSLVERPAWAPGRADIPGQLMLYFAHHKGRHIRLALADRPEGPWRIHKPGVLPLAATPLAQTPPRVPQPDWAVALGTDGLYPHLASPDVWFDHDARKLRMLFHGLAADGEQVTYAASSPDGFDWRVNGPPIPESYMRRFSHGGATYAMARLGRLWRDGPGGWEPGPLPLSGTPRHVAVLVRGNVLHVFFTRIGDAPERVVHTVLDLSLPWGDWRAGDETELLRPERAWEGADEPLRPSIIGAVDFANELRDPYVFAFEGRSFMIYACGGEAALGLAELSGI